MYDQYWPWPVCPMGQILFKCEYRKLATTCPLWANNNVIPVVSYGRRQMWQSRVEILLRISFALLHSKHSSVELGSYALGELINTYHVYTAHMSPALNRSFALECFEDSNENEIRNRMFDFYPGLPQMLEQIRAAFMPNCIVKIHTMYRIRCWSNILHLLSVMVITFSSPICLTLLTSLPPPPLPNSWACDHLSVLLHG